MRIFRTIRKKKTETKAETIPVICWNSSKHIGTEITEQQFAHIIKTVSELNDQ